MMKPTHVNPTPKRPFLIREEGHPLKQNASIFRIYDQQLQPLSIARETLAEAITALQETELVSSLTVVYRRELTLSEHVQGDPTQRKEMLGAYFQAPPEDDEITRLHAVIDSLTEDLKIMLNFVRDKDGKVPGPYLRVFEQNIVDTEAILAFSQNNAPAVSWNQLSMGGAPTQAASARSWRQPQGDFGQSGPDMPQQDAGMMLHTTDPQGGIGLVRIEEGKEPGRIYEVRKESLSIGRSRESDIFLEDLAVSRLHVSILNMGNGSYALKDEGSANGTKVNGQLVNKYQTYPLQEGDRIEIGETVLVFGRH